MHVSEPEIWVLEHSPLPITRALQGKVSSYYALRREGFTPQKVRASRITALSSQLCEFTHMKSLSQKHRVPLWPSWELVPAFPGSAHTIGTISFLLPALPPPPTPISTPLFFIFLCDHPRPRS